MRMSGKSFRDLEVWQLAMTLGDIVYGATDKRRSNFARRRRYATEFELRKAEELGNRVSMMLYKLIDSLNP